MSGAWERLHEHVNFHPNFRSSNSLYIGKQARIYKQYGFVHYTVPEEAEAAINGMNNRIIAAWQNDVMPTCKMPLSPVTQWRLQLLHLGFTKDRDYQLTVKYANSSEKAQIPWQRDALQNELSTARSKLNLSGWEKRDEAKRSEVYRVICWSQQRLLQITLFLVTIVLDSEGHDFITTIFGPYVAIPDGTPRKVLLPWEQLVCPVQRVLGLVKGKCHRLRCTSVDCHQVQSPEFFGMGGKAHENLVI